MICLCDHDLRFDSCMYGGSFTTSLNCNAIGPNCTNSEYVLTDELNYSANRITEYYAIAGLDYYSDELYTNDMGFEIDPNYSTFDDITNDLQNKTDDLLYTTNEYGRPIPINIQSEGDNVVGFLSQIGCTESGNRAPDKKICFKKIFVNIDSNGGNNIYDHFHGKMPHRTIVMEQVFSYLTE